MSPEIRKKSVSERFTDAFHRHLDECRRCRETPTDLCEVGAVLLRAAVNTADIGLPILDLP